MRHVNPISNNSNGKLFILPETSTVKPFSAITSDFICGEQCSIGRNFIVDPSVSMITIGNNVVIGDKVTIISSKEGSEVFIGHNVYIGNESIIYASCIADNANIGKHVTIMDDVFVSASCTIDDYSFIKSRTYIKEGMRIKANPKITA